MVIIVMGVTGAGKTTIGSLFAEQMGWEFADADGFHSAANKAKMHQGIPLTDADRTPWLQAMREAIVHWIAQNKNVVLACSALKHSYRNELRVGEEVKFVYLRGTQELITARLEYRHGHFAGESILTNQFAVLEEPENAIAVDIHATPEEIVSEIRKRLNV
jgi:gluconokinase